MPFATKLFLQELQSLQISARLRFAPTPSLVALKDGPDAAPMRIDVDLAEA